MASDGGRDHDDLVNFSHSVKHSVADGDNEVKVFAQDHISQLVSKAEHLQAKGDYTAASRLLCQVLSSPLSHGAYYSLDARATHRRIVALLFDQYPWLPKQPEANDPFTSPNLAVTELPIDTSDLNTLLAVRAVADWCCHPHEHRTAPAHSLYARLHPCMEQVVGLQHLETFRLLYHWGKCGYQQLLECSPGLPLNHSEIEERCQVALLGLDKVLGRHDPETIDCARTLGHIFLQQKKNFKAQATFEELYRGQVTEFGAADDRSLWSLSDLAKAFAQEGDHVRAGNLIWSAPVESRPLQLLVRGEGATAYNDQSYALATRKVPKHFIWESKALYCLPIRRLQFRAIYPFDYEKRLLWHPSGDHEGEPTTFKYTFEVKDNESIHLIVPYIPYSHFSTSRDFSGFTYQYYATVDDPNTHHSTSMSWAYYRSRESTCVKKVKWTHRGDLPVWHPFGEGTTTSHVTGFFNDIPGDTAVCDNAADIGYHLVSSDWVDYNSFTLHTTAEALTPKLKSADGSMITCRGYISGTWTTFDAERVWSGLMVFVMDAAFSESPQSNRLHHFLLSPALLQRASQHDLTSDDKRSLAASLNPTLLYFRPPLFEQDAALGRSYPDFHTPLQKEYMDEMNRRQKWDRSFENRLIKSGEYSKDWFQQKKEEEDHRRMKWDKEHVGPLTADRDDGGQLLQPPPDAPPIDSKPWNPFIETIKGHKINDS